MKRTQDWQKGIFGVIHEHALTQPPFKTRGLRDGLVIQVGEGSIKVVEDLIQFVTFFGALLTAIAYTVFHPRSLRTKDVLFI